jgi:hypothetical protein
MGLRENTIYKKRRIEWEHSSFREFVRKGIYQPDWGAEKSIEFDGMAGNE